MAGPAVGWILGGIGILLKRIFAPMLGWMVRVFGSWWVLIVHFLIQGIAYLIFGAVSTVLTWYFTQKSEVSGYLIEKIFASIGFGELTLQLTGLSAWLADCFRIMDMFTLLLSYMGAMLAYKLSPKFFMKK